jgi:hypothetical protein
LSGAKDVEAAAAVLRRLLEKVDAGEMSARSRRDKAIVAGLRGALLGLNAATRACRGSG